MRGCIFCKLKFLHLNSARILLKFSNLISGFYLFCFVFCDFFIFLVIFLFFLREFFRRKVHKIFSSIFTPRIMEQTFLLERSVYRIAMIILPRNFRNGNNFKGSSPFISLLSNVFILFKPHIYIHIRLNKRHIRCEETGTVCLSYAREHAKMLIFSEHSWIF